MKVLGIHHVTAVSAQIEANLAFYTGVLGMRLVKKSVNQDDVSAYHLFYADKVGSPGTDLTFFDWPSIQPNRPGAGTVALTTLRIPDGSIGSWQERLGNEFVSFNQDLAGRNRIMLTDGEGQSLALVEDSGLPGTVVPWTASVPESMAIRGILGVDIASARPDSTRRVLNEILGYEDTDGSRFFTSGEDYASEIIVREPTDNGFGQVGAGGVHHVAFRVRNDVELREFQDEIESFGIRTSGYIDRYYFHSLYFREPGGVLFELATEGPGFASDEDAEHLGEGIALPPFLEPRRESIVANLKPLPVPTYLSLKQS
jgi:glyoxalase family protein